MATTKRADLRAALITVLQAQATATPTLLRAVHPARPGSFMETPCAYVGAMDETLVHGGAAVGYGLRTRTFTGVTVVLVDTLLDPTATVDRMDDLIDALVDRFTAAYAAVTGGILEMSAVSDTDLEQPRADGSSLIYRASVLSFGRTFYTEGRT